MEDDPFERAARREARLLDRGPSRMRRRAIRSLVGLQAAWAVLLALHWWLAGGDGRLLNAHGILFALGLAFTAFSSLSMLGGHRWPMIGIMAGWAVLLALHWTLAGGRTFFVTAHTATYAVVLAAAVLAVIAAPSVGHRTRL